MDRQLLAELKATLQRRESELVNELANEQDRAANEPFERLASEVPDAGDASVADVAVDWASSERERDTAELAEVRDALGRMASGGYGICRECGEPIPPERLRAFPTARFDLAHQRSRERDAARAPTL
jgi:RNA polymerase-binding transcription factor DksA